ncbi:MFS transporter [Enterocloster aldenensis]|uniref:MFS transporter n=1 Tax=Enterocloster aldenensis TaxID=358742 RepID=UPI004026B7CB
MNTRPLEENGIHRAKLWEIAFYAMNNTSTNAYMFLVASISYFLVGIVGVGAVLAGSVVTIMRVWDGVTDPFVGILLDNTNTKFGKNRPFIVAGQMILFGMTFIMFHMLPGIPTGIRFIVFIVMYAVYIIGYTCQCVVTKSAQTCLTSDPQQRPIFSMFDSAYGVLYNNIFWPVYLSVTLVPKYTINTLDAPEKINALIAQNPSLRNVLIMGENGIQSLSGLYNPAMWYEAQITVGIISAILAILSIVGLSRKDKPKYYGLGKSQRVSFRDYADVMAHNRGIQMLVLAASSDKLAINCTTSATVLVALFGICFGNFALSGSVSAITGIPIAIFGVVGMGVIAIRMGQKKCLIVGTWGALLSAIAMGILIIAGRSKGLVLPTFSLTQPDTWTNLFYGSSWSFIGVIFICLYIIMNGFSKLSGSIVIPMTADCADYEVYRSGRYVPGLMGTLFSFVDKCISSLATTIIAVSYAVVGFSNKLPTAEDSFSSGILYATLFCYLGMPAIGWILNVIAMKFYPLTKEKMDEIQDEINEIKARSTAI